MLQKSSEGTKARKPHKRIAVVMVRNMQLIIARFSVSLGGLVGLILKLKKKLFRECGIMFRNKRFGLSILRWWVQILYFNFVCHLCTFFLNWKNNYFLETTLIKFIKTPHQSSKSPNKTPSNPSEIPSS